MPNETNAPKLTPDDIDRTLLLWKDEKYLSDLIHRESLDKDDRFMDLVDQRRAERQSTKRPTTDFRATIDKNVSKTKRIPIEQLEEDREIREEAAQQDAEQSVTNLHAARLDQFGGRVPVLYEGQVVDFENPNEQNEQPSEVKKGTHSRRVHKPKNSRSKVLARLCSTQKSIADDDASVKTDRELRGDL